MADIALPIQRSRTIGATITARLPELAEAVVDRHFAAYPEVAEVYDARGRALYVRDMHFNLQYLAQALALADPKLFLDYVAWMKVLLTSHGVREIDVRNNLQLTAAVLEDVLSRSESEMALQLLDTAVSLFAEKGYGGATTAELARAAGVTEPIIYRHFASKKDLFVAVIDRTSELTISRWDRQLSNARDAAQRLRRLIGTNPMISDRGRGIYRVILQAMMEIDDPDILEAIQRHVKALHRFVTDAVRRAQDEGWVSRAFSPEITAWLLLHLGLGFGVLEALGIENHAIDSNKTSVRHVVTMLMLGDRAKQLQDEYFRRAQSGSN